MNSTIEINTLGALKASGYVPKSVKQELRDNLIARLRNNEVVFPGIFGYDDTVIPELQRAILSMHHINLLGLRGQAKTRIAREMVNLLDEYIPVVAGSELNDDPLAPLSRYAKDVIAEKGDDTPVSWMHRSERYTEKLATPDVSVADLIGDADPIKAASLKLPYSDERVIHFGLIPRSHRGIFVINELPDLQARIQVALFNILQEGDIQIRGFKMRLPLDLQFVFTANPEDYTNRGSIVTPLKDRIDSQIITHYPATLDIGKRITAQEARVKSGQEAVFVPDLAATLIEQLAFAARESEYVDAKSGVSARLTISAMENLRSTAERRMILAGEVATTVRIADFWGVIPAITGKVELVYEGEQEGALIVATNMISTSIRKQFNELFPDPEKAKKNKKGNVYQTITDWFEKGHLVEITNSTITLEYRNLLDSIPGLLALIQASVPDLGDEDERYLYMEFALFGLAEYNVISRSALPEGSRFSDMLAGMFGKNNFNDDEDSGGGYYEDPDTTRPKKRK